MNYKHLTIEERCCLREYYKQGYSYRMIAELLGRNVSTISREINRNKTFMNVKPAYYPHTAQKKYLLRRSYCHRGMFQDPTKLDYIKARLLETWSPEQIANTPWEKALPSTRTIYRWIYEKYIDVNLKVLRRKGKSSGTKETRENTTAGKRSESGIRAFISGWNSDTGKQIPSYPDEGNQKHASRLWLNERQGSISQSRCRIRVQTAW